ncbi:MAG: zinc-dependent peptidase [Kangiellaceae bacterium]|nr:zinc-dependent peptidase [Kangiellaceae bacterium]MCW8999632.1 zinc-dependent peptidase [Kangiellaceae bacterium]
MDPLIILTIVTTVLVLLVLLKPRYVTYKRAQAAKRPFPAEWRQILKKNVPYFYKMPADLQLQLKKHIQIFLSEKQFEGFEGVEINDEIKVTIAAQACLLILNRETGFYPKLKSIYVYPAAFVAQHSSRDTAGVLQQHQRVLSGESWELGKVILSWKDTKEGGTDHQDGQNVVIHEFAHQLDQETGVANGAPFLRHREKGCWSGVLANEFETLQRQASQGIHSLLDHYGATNPAEFFAVASEVFFEKPYQLQKQHPALYRQLSGFYHIDPTIW